MTALLADTHVHVHSGYDPVRFLDAAAENFRRVAAARSLRDASFALCFADLPGRDSRAALADAGGGWTIRREEGGPAAVREADRTVLHLVPGHQRVSAEGLEVLALDTDHPLADAGLPLEQLISAIREIDGVPVLPWGVGKWTGTRARLVQSLLAARSGVRFADNGNRLRSSPVPASLRYAVDHGGAPLAGSDPLPMSSHQVRAGCYVTVWQNGAVGSVREHLRHVLSRPCACDWAGELTSPWRFLRDQVLMQRDKHAPWLRRRS